MCPLNKPLRVSAIPLAEFSREQSTQGCPHRAHALNRRWVPTKPPGNNWELGGMKATPLATRQRPGRFCQGSSASPILRSLIQNISCSQGPVWSILRMRAIQEDWFKTSDVGQGVIISLNTDLSAPRTSDLISLQVKLNPEHKLHFLKKRNLALRQQPPWLQGMSVFTHLYRACWLY